MESEKQREMNEKKISLRGMWNTIKKASIHRMGEQEEEERKKW